ncbi:hypothetical protein EVAR_92590_1 [Eumeta japonica]|uniref:Uncharacterized protein n=1 Tax=Eumeta variegata TaxID=151549 RepID=A0A4C1SXF0_EUMVA|nr:hypothetical protein EVAR_92590_1 [Eumeta japonica]
MKIKFKSIQPQWRPACTNAQTEKKTLHIYYLFVRSVQSINAYNWRSGSLLDVLATGSWAACNQRPSLGRRSAQSMPSHCNIRLGPKSNPKLCHQPDDAPEAPVNLNNKEVAPAD